MPTEFKKGVWNPDIELITEEPYKTSMDKDIYCGCCLLCNNRNIHRAVNTGNIDLLRKCVFDKENISNLCATWSTNDLTNPLDLIIKKGDPKMLEEFLRPKISHAKN
jgi:hypothetical protein